MPQIDRYEREVVRLALLAGDEGAVRDKEFVDCDVHGPAVVFIGDETRIEGCSWTGDFESLLWEIPAHRTQIVGAIHVERSGFVGCRFQNVGIAAPAAAIPQIRAGFGA